MTGTSTNPGVKQKVERTHQEVNFYSLYQGFVTYATGADGKYPSTRTSPEMEEDSTSAVFAILLQDGYIAGQQLISPNEFLEVTPAYTADGFGPENTSFCLLDYDADGWKRYPNWGQYARNRTAMLSDRWIDDPSVPQSIRNVQAEEDDPGYWNVLFSDGASERLMGSPILANGDHLFEVDEDQGASDALMVRD